MGQWRLDLGLMVLYQLTLFFSAQMLFVIFLEYMPSTYCDANNHCHKLRSKCLTDYDPNQQSLCPLNAPPTDQCVLEKKKIDFISAQYEYQQDCTSLRSFSASSATFLGTLIGNIVLGYLSDRLGRKPVYIASVIIGVPSIIFGAAINHIVPYYIFRFCIGFSIAGTLTVGWTYGSEMVSPRMRFRLRTFSNWANARMMQVGVAYLAGEWRLTSYICAAISFLILPIMAILPESPVYLEQKRKYERAAVARKRIAVLTGDPYEERTYADEKPLKKITLKIMFQSPTLRKNFAVLCLMWFYVGTVSFITDLNGSDMSSNLYVGQFFSGLILSMAGIFIGTAEPYLPWLGRRTVFLVAQSIAIVTYILILIALYTDQKQTTWYTISYMCAYAFQSICLDSCYLCLAELIPTDLRSTVGAIANNLFKVGTILASLSKPLKYAYEPGLFWINLILSSIGITVGQDEIQDKNGDIDEKEELTNQKEIELDKFGKLDAHFLNYFICIRSVVQCQLSIKRCSRIPN
ncbi:unnamed protein product [Caenorhabditis angaria]|uniref:Major facilitator superfamily (MFS) profile domain-containing protein n=1 Tax=Caenorhabditis angaria TaxID=860376 RepID=A0A9P1N5K5_9PELO|nr:unnamed protein product [Caenorhabditis angaria]